MAELDEYVRAWRACCDELVALLPSLPAGAWSVETDCPGWDVHDVVAHLAAIEHELATGEGPPERASGSNPVSAYTQAGVDARRDRTPEELVAEFSAAVNSRARALASHPPTDPKGRPPRTPGGIDWDWDRFLRNRVIDIWCHQQDIRRAAQHPGGFGTPATTITVGMFLSAVPMVFGRRAGAQPGDSLLLNLDGNQRGFVVDESGQCHPAVIDKPTVAVSLSVEDLTVLGAGRRRPEDLNVKISGDTAMAQRFLTGLAVTP
ncbi:MAG: maleylpyruvate isomerase N-terminal domain-containing protein [Actinomycetales bacterium]